jgi:galactose mutarotase-like enzyme
MNVSLENDLIKIVVKEKGAELNSLVSKITGLQYMWSGDPVYWGKTSPILFPIVGTLKDNTYLHEGKKYTLTRHGFARDLVFQIAEQKNDHITFSLSSTQTTRINYPFDFELRVKYQLLNDFLKVSYEVLNKGDKPMFFSIGAHPAFKIPLVEGSMYDDHFLQFNEKENAPRWPISAEGLIKETSISFLKNSDIINLTRNLFDEDALVFKNLQSNMVSLKSTKHPHGLDFYFEGFSYLGIWAAKNADFVCIEPWCGIADSVAHDQKFASKEGIEKIGQGESWTRTWKVKLY